MQYVEAGLKAGNRYNETGLLVIVSAKTQPQKMQLNSRQRFLSVIQLLVSFREIPVRVFDALQTRIRRVCFVVEQIPAEISLPFHIAFYYFFYLAHRYKAKELMIPFAAWNTK